MAKEGIEFKSRGVLLDGTAPTVMRRSSRRWVQGTLGLARDFARVISPFLTGRYRLSLRYETKDTAQGVSGTLYSTDSPGKVGVIEYGHPPRGENGKGREGRYVINRTYTRYLDLLRSQGHVLEASLSEAFNQ